MSSPYIKLGNRSLDQWKVTELKEELKKRKLTISGLKQDLVKRLDQAIRIEMESSMDNAEEDATQSEVPVEKPNAYNISGKAKDFLDGKMDLVEKVEPKSGHAVDDCRGLSGEGNFIEADLAHGVDATGLEREQVPESSVMEITEITETVDLVMPSTESDSQNHGKNEDIAASAFLINDGYPQEDVKLEQSPQINERSTPVVPLNGQNLLKSETQNEAIHSKDQGENDGLKCLQPDPTDQPLNHLVSDVDTNLGFQVTSDYVSTESVSITEKNELKIDVIDDNVKLELDVKPEMVQQPPSSGVPDGGESHPMDIGEPLDKKDITDHFDNKDVVVENVASLKSIDGGDIGHPEKLNLDRSSGDDSMEEDVMESKHVDDKSDSFTENMEKSGTPSVKEEDHVDVVGHDKPVEMVEHVEMKATDIGNETASTLTSGKRKILDKEAVSNNDAAKKMRRWNAEGFKSSQIGSKTPKGSSEPDLKPIPGTNTITSVEAPKERVVPPASRQPTNSLRIDRFLRPFTLKAVQELLGKNGTVTSFWMDHIKTHCYVSYSSVEEAAETRNAVYNLQWPPNGGRLLVAEFVDPEEVKSRIEAPLASPATPSTSTTPTQTPSAAQPSPRQQIPAPLPPPPLSNPPHIRERLHQPPPRDRLNLPPPVPEKVDPPILTLDDLFQKTKATPRIYYLPLSDEVVAAKMKTQGKNVTQ